MTIEKISSTEDFRNFINNNSKKLTMVTKLKFTSGNWNGDLDFEGKFTKLEGIFFPKGVGNIGDRYMSENMLNNLPKHRIGCYSGEEFSINI